MRHFWALVLILSLYPAAPSVGEETTGSTQAFRSDGRVRNFILHRPAKLKKSAPLVLVLHGNGSSGRRIMNYSGMNHVADKNGFAVCYPDAVMGENGKKAWNVGYANLRVDDVAFLTSLLKHLQSTYDLSVKHSFCTGMSNGGDMTVLLACKEPQRFAAVAPVAGCLMTWVAKAGKSSLPIPIFITNGTADSTTLWKGDKNYFAKPINGYLSTKDMVAFWVEKNKASRASQVVLPDKNEKDRSTVKFEIWNDSKKQNPVWLYTLENGGHDWPGAFGNMDVNMSHDIWMFFEQSIR